MILTGKHTFLVFDCHLIVQKNKLDIIQFKKPHNKKLIK